MRISLLLRLLITASVVALTAHCSTPAPAPTPPPEPTTSEGNGALTADDLYRSPRDHDFDENPVLLERLRTSTYDYFRWVNIPFARAVCRLFEDDLVGMPFVNLHGDAHLEQYAVTVPGRGLADYDDASTGPAVIDLVRFGVSIVLAAEELGYEASTDDLITIFFDGYRSALHDPTTMCRAPDFVARSRTQFSDDRSVFLDFAESLMSPVDPELEDEYIAGFDRFAEVMYAQHPDIRPGFFDLVHMGRLRTGVGSAMDLKFLVRVAGPSDDPVDDVILEAKQLRDLSAITCLQNGSAGGAFRILISQARIARQGHTFLGFVPSAAQPVYDVPFWVQSWFENYVELDVSDIRSLAELSDIVFDVGVQLGAGHTREIAAPLDTMLRVAQLQLLDDYEDALRDAIDLMAELTREAWQRFVDDASTLEGG